MANKVLVLGFTTTPSEKKVAITINKPAEKLTPSDIKTAMEQMIAQNIYKAVAENKDVELIGSIAYAKYVTTADTEYDFE